MLDEKKLLAEIHRNCPGKIKGIIAHELSSLSQLYRFFEDINHPFEAGALRRYSSFRFLLNNPEQFCAQVQEYYESFNEYNLWLVYRQFAEEIRLELLHRGKDEAVS